MINYAPNAVMTRLLDVQHAMAHTFWDQENAAISKDAWHALWTHSNAVVAEQNTH